MYPNDYTSISMSTTWNSGSYRPNDVVRSIRDNYTPINKNSMRNSVGNEISLLQNYVNSKYLGRVDIPVASGFVNNIISNSGEVFVFNSGFDEGYESPSDLVDSVSIRSDHISIYHSPQDPISGSGKLNSFGLYTISFNGILDPQYRELIVDNQHLRIAGAGGGSVESSYGLGSWYVDIIPYLGAEFRNVVSHNSDIYQVLYGVSGIDWSYSDQYGANNKYISITPDISNESLRVTASYISLPNVYAEWTFPEYVFATGVAGTSVFSHNVAIFNNAYVTNGVYSSTVSASGGVAFNTTTTSLTPTGIAVMATGSDTVKIAAILDVLKNVGLMSKV
jgi:hypothetical protein